MNVSQFLSLSYWFDTAPVSDFRYLDVLTWCLVALFVVGIALHLIGRFVAMHPVVRKFIRRLPGGIYLTAVISAFLVFARFQRAPYLSMRIWLLVTFGAFMVWLIVLLVKFVGNHKREVAAYSKRKENKKQKRRLKK